MSPFHEAPSSQHLPDQSDAGINQHVFVALLPDELSTRQPTPEPLPGDRTKGAPGSGNNVEPGSTVPAPDSTSTTNHTAEPVVWPSMKVFTGSYYHKELSTVDNWNGITATVRLGEPVIDPHRLAKNKHHQLTNLDDFSIYLGGITSGRTVEAGLSWEVTLDKNGKKDELHKVWRPFWRSPAWHNAPPQSKYYWKPGDVVNMTLSVDRINHMKLTVADVGPHPKQSYTVDFSAPGVRPGEPISMRRVTAIDQSGREGMSVVPTNAKLIGTIWENTNLLRTTASGVEQIPLTSALEKQIDTPPGHINVRSIPLDATASGEYVDIYGKRHAQK
ncbi:MAG TPA: hypothetical protein V6C69_01735 [Trichormus sp.]|jgi:hypothetical protein